MHSPGWAIIGNRRFEGASVCAAATLPLQDRRPRLSQRNAILHLRAAMQYRVLRLYEAPAASQG
jgi:hypothetical protein